MLLAPIDDGRPNIVARRPHCRPVVAFCHSVLERKNPEEKHKWSRWIKKKRWRVEVTWLTEDVRVECCPMDDMQVRFLNFWLISYNVIKE